jgi:ABC-type lipoprotein release transport system permease subunit
MNFVTRHINSIRVGWFLGTRQLRRSGKGTSALIVVIMALTFLNLTVVSGILIGLVEGSSEAIRKQSTADVIVQAPQDREYIEKSQELIQLVKSQGEVESFSPRYVSSGLLTANWRQSLKPGQTPNAVGARIIGIDPNMEAATTDLPGLVMEGRYLAPDSDGQILVGSRLLSEYGGSAPSDDDLLNGVKLGDKLRISLGGRNYEMTVRGIVDSKIQDVSRAVFISDRELRQMLGRSTVNVNEIAIKLKPGSDPYLVKRSLSLAHFDEYADIKTWDEAQGSFITDIRRTFQLLGDVIGAIAVAVAAITVFIVVFIGAVNRRREIGVLKGIGISSNAIVFSYVIQAITYAVAGTLIGALLLFGAIEPYFRANPINFPFSDGILAVTTVGAGLRAAILLITAAVAGCLPTRLIVRRNTLDTILGR